VSAEQRRIAIEEPTPEAFEVGVLIRHAREYVSVRSCECRGSTQCWRCVFQYDLAHIDAKKEAE